MNSQKWASLHCHSQNSLLDGFGKPDVIAKRCKELGHVASALTDHGSISGLCEHFKACKKHEIKFIAGCEFYYSKDASIRDMTNRELSHVVILAKNLAGWNELIQCVSVSNLPENFYFKPRIDHKIMRQYLGNGNHICITGHPGTELSNSLFPDNLCYRAKTVEEARKNLYPDWKQRAVSVINDHLDIFGENLFIEIQLIDAVNLPVSVVIAECLREIVTESNGKLNPIGTADSHYVYKSDAEYQRILLCSALGRTMPSIQRDLSNGKDVPLGTFFISDNYHIPSVDELLPIHTKEELENAVRIASMCEDYDILGPPQLPKFDCPGGIEEYEFLTQLCRVGWKNLLVNKGVVENEETKNIYLERIKKELAIIKDANLSGYFLIVQDIIGYCRERGWMVGPGRGSAAGCLISYLIGITSIDPIPYDLIFERFYSAARAGSLPDIDLDVPSEYRDEVIAYIKKKYGEENVSQMVTFNALMGRSALKEVLKIEGTTGFSEMNEITKDVPNEAEIIDDLQETNETSIIRWALKNRASKLEQWCTIDEEGNLHGDYAEVFRKAIAIEGTKKSQGKHAAGVIISAYPLASVCPMVRDKQGVPIAGFEMGDLEALGHVKFDILGIDLLSKLMKITAFDPSLNINDLEDQNTWDMLCQGDVKGVFQLERQKRWTKDLKPRNIHHLSALIAIIRPGVADAMLDGKSMTKHYVDRKNALEETSYLFDCLEPILNKNYGILIYQEEALRIAAEIAQFNLLEADALRKCVTGDTMFISKSRGYISIDILLKDGYKDDLFLIMDDLGKQEWKNITDIWSTGKQSVTEVETSSGMSVKATKYHQFLTNNDWKCRMKLSEDDFIVSAREIEYDGFDHIDNSLAMIIAGIITEGYFVKGSSTFTNYDEDMMKIFSEHFYNVFKKTKSNNDEKIFYIKKEEREYLNKYINYGLSEFKEIPQEMMGMTKQSTRNFLSFMFGAECGITLQSNQVEYSSKSNKMIKQVQLLLLRFGIRSYILDKRVADYLDKKYYSLYINDIKDQEKLHSELMEYWPKYKKDQLNTIISKNRKANFTTDVIPSNIVKKLLNQYPYVGRNESGTLYTSSISRERFDRIVEKSKDKKWKNLSNGKHQYLKIKNLDKISKKETYDFTIGDCNTPYIIANGLVIHNCIGKKLVEKMAELKNKFINGCVDSGKLNINEATQLFEWIEKSQKYLFNASHSYSYAINAFQSAYCKANNPGKFYEVYLDHAKRKQDSLEEIRLLVNDAKLHDIEVLPPNLENFHRNFLLVGTDKIFFGISNIKDVGETECEKIFDIVGDIDLKNLTWIEILAYMSDRINKRAITALISTGALNGPNNKVSRAQMMYEYESWKNLTKKEKEHIISRIQPKENLAYHVRDLINTCKIAKNRLVNVSSIYKSVSQPLYSMYDDESKISELENKYLGISLSCSKVDGIMEHSANATCKEVYTNSIRGICTLLVEIKSFREIKIKNGQNKGEPMAFLSVEDSSATLDSAVLFTEAYKQHKGLLFEGNTVMLTGKTSDKKDGSFIVDTVVMV